MIDEFKGLPVDPTYWANVYMDGLDPYIKKPRDIVRIMNSLVVTYPAVAGEVNTVDFIAMEFLRIFEPNLYATVRDNRSMFTGHSNDPYGLGRRDSGKAFHESWLAQVPEARREHVRALMKRLFPRLQSVWGNMGYSASHEVKWRNALRACSPEIFDVYFQFGVAVDVLSRRELNELLSAAQKDATEAAKILMTASDIRRPSGACKATDYLDRLRDLEDEITPVIAAVLVTVLATVGDTLLTAQDEEASGPFTLPNRWRILGVINHLLKHAEASDRLSLIESIVSQGHSIALAGDVIETVEELKAKPENAHAWVLAEVSDDLLVKLKQAWTHRLRILGPSDLLATPELDFILNRWMRWDDPKEVLRRVRPLFESDETLPFILERHLRFGRRQVSGDVAATRVPLLNPKHFENLIDIVALEPRVRSMLARKDLTDNQRIAAEQYLLAMSRINDGKNLGPMSYD